MHGSGHVVTGCPTGQALSLPQSPADCGGGTALPRTPDPGVCAAARQGFWETPRGSIIYTGVSSLTGSSRSPGQVTGQLAPQPGPAVDPAPQPPEFLSK